MPGHAETLATASAITADVAGISIIGLGHGASRPTLTFSDTAATVVVSAASVTIQNIITKPSVDSVVSPIVVSGSDCWLDFEHQDESATVEALRAVLTTAGADRLYVNLEYRGFNAGNACVNAIRLVGVDGGDINVNFYGLCSTAVVELHTTACNDIRVTGHTHVDGFSDGSRNVVDTVTGSRWYAVIEDHAAGSTYTGGYAAALASDDVSTINSKIGTITNTGGTATIGAVIGDFANTTLISKLDVPAADATANVNISDAIGNKEDAFLTDSSTTGSAMAYLKGLVEGIMADSGIAAYPGAAAPANSVSLAQVMRAIYDRQLGDGTDASTNSVLGKRVLRGAADVFDGTTTALFTVSGGRVVVTHLEGEVTGAAVDNTVSNTKFVMNPTVGTDRDLCAVLDIDSDELGTITRSLVLVQMHCKAVLVAVLLECREVVLFALKAL